MIALAFDDVPMDVDDIVNERGDILLLLLCLMPSYVVFLSSLFLLLV